MYRFLFWLIFSATLSAQSGRIAVSGTVKDSVTGLPVPGSTVYMKEIMRGAACNEAGFFSFTLAPGHYTFSVSHIGYTTVRIPVFLAKGSSNFVLNVSLPPTQILNKEIVVLGNKQGNILSVQEMSAKEIQKIPTAFNDVLRSVTVLAGVSTNNELSSGYNVRGGNFAENLIYLNGWEIYRPFLLKQGIEENQSLINPDLVDNLSFYNAAFPVEFGDKLSSALSVKYGKPAAGEKKGKLRASLLNGALSVTEGREKISWAAALRYAYPGLFVSKLQTNGAYHPEFVDGQFLINAKPDASSELAFVGLFGRNFFNVTPQDWTGNFRSDRSVGFASAVQILYKGNSSYRFNNALAGLTYTRVLDTTASYLFGISYYNLLEKESSALTSDYYYSADALAVKEYREYLKQRIERINNRVDYRQFELKAEFNKIFSNHIIHTGINLKKKIVFDRVDEYLSETGDSSLYDQPLNKFSDTRYSPDEFAFFIKDTYRPDILSELTGGIRISYFAFTNELKISPRLRFVRKLSETDFIAAGFGIYFQPPQYLEARNQLTGLQSQQSIHFTLGWEGLIREKLNIRTEVYYKLLSELIPYTTEGQKIIYTGGNANSGYAAGFDIQIHGEVVEGMNSWLGYGYLSTRERSAASGKLNRRLTDQTHSFLFFLQDRIRKHSNWQAHTRILLGSGNLYHERIIIPDPVSGKSIMVPKYDDPLEFFLYYRLDVGLSVEIPLTSKRKLSISAEILNMFNQNNYASYKFIQVFKDIRYPVRIPEVLSPRFFNIQAEFTF